MFLSEEESRKKWLKIMHSDQLSFTAHSLVLQIVMKMGNSEPNYYKLVIVFMF